MSGLGGAGSGAMVCLMGPTAAGKTEVALALARSLPVDVISVDSAQVYRHLDIGTGKPSAAVLREVPHALVDVREPQDSYSAAQFAADAAQLVRGSWARDRLPLLVGGTGLYFRALRQGLSSLPAAAPALRAELEAAALRLGRLGMHDWLHRLDAPSAARLHPHDAQRVQRALEVALLAGRPMSGLLGGARAALPARALVLVLAPASRAQLHERIATRFRAMLRAGLIDEVRGLMLRPGVHRELPSMRSVGYRQTWDYLAGDRALAELAERGIVATRQLARRQLTWLRKEADASWLDSGEPGCAVRVREVVETFLDSAAGRAGSVP